MRPFVVSWSVWTLAACHSPCETQELGPAAEPAAQATLQALTASLTLPLCVDRVEVVDDAREPARYRRASRTIKLSSALTDDEARRALRHAAYHALEADHRLFATYGDDLPDELRAIDRHDGLNRTEEALAILFALGPTASIGFAPFDCPSAASHTPDLIAREWLARTVFDAATADGVEIRPAGSMPWARSFYPYGAASDGHHIAVGQVPTELGLGHRAWLNPRTGELVPAEDDRTGWTPPTFADCPQVGPEDWRPTWYAPVNRIACLPSGTSVAMATHPIGPTHRLMTTDPAGVWRSAGRCGADVSDLVWLQEALWLVEWSDQAQELSWYEVLDR